MRDKPSVSIIVPAYNCEKTIGRCITSAVNQTYRNTEIIVVNDGSTDHTDQIITSFEGKIKVIRQKNSGVCAARNRGIQEARGEWIAFLDSDDWIDEDFVSSMVEARTGVSNEIIMSDFMLSTGPEFGLKRQELSHEQIFPDKMGGVFATA